ncbi:hypothetical protein HYH02_012414 [Chlamydomonas schloesseri]|uniref:Uncharacterized protein n=1 Tax=Chlamydomonas schloesseri TaxID=2026947 RepID=A0A835SZN7_9CHLO|nr:hypothetical protein HYH02_012414 [Chlamydomonas schloesseri]|eukprot:KAG2434402.1 hypothetical protein HYH02_012414 [Chlamydomonas schloesseri]
MKTVSLRWRGGCFCCPAIISFGQCMSGMWAASRKPKQEADSLAHWGLNAAKFLYEAGPPQGPGAGGGGGGGAPGAAALGRMLLVEGGFMPLTAGLLAAAGAGEEVPQGMMLTPQVSFTQVWAVGIKQLPLTTTPQLVLVQLLGQVTEWTPGLRAAAHCPELLSSLVRTLAATSDDRYRSLVLSTLTDWLGVVDDEDDDDEDDVKQEEQDGERGQGQDKAQDAAPDTKAVAATKRASAAAGGAPAAARPPRSPHLFSPAEHDALVHSLLDAGLAPALAAVAARTANAVALRNVAACALALMTAGAGAGGHGGASGEHGAGPAAAAAAGKGRGAAAAAALTDPELPAGLVLRGAAQCRAQAELVKAGMVQSLLTALSRPPCPPAPGASPPAASPLVFWLSINMGVTGARLLEVQWWLLVVARVLLVPPEAGPAAAGGGAGTTADAASSSTSSSSSSSGTGKGGKSGSGKRKGSSGGAGANGSSGGSAAGADAVKRRAAAADAVLSAPVLQQQLKGLETQEAAGAAPAPAAAAPTERAVQLLSAAVTASSRGCALPWGQPLELLPARERGATPDWRAAQRDRIRKAAEEARAAAAQASASAAVDLLSKLAVE